jgi:hypothetical protein
MVGAMDMPRLFVLRVWNAPLAFRAVVRDVGPERTAYFSDPDALCRFLFGCEVPAGPPKGSCPPTVGPEPAPPACRTPPTGS